MSNLKPWEKDYITEEHGPWDKDFVSDEIVATEEPSLLSKAGNLLSETVDKASQKASDIGSGISNTVGTMFSPDDPNQKTTKSDAAFLAARSGLSLGTNKVIEPALAATLSTGVDEEHQKYLEDLARKTQAQEEAAMRKIEGKIPTSNKKDQLIEMLSQLQQLRGETKAPEKQSWVDRYYTAKQGLSEEEAQAMSEHPGVYLGTNIAAGIPAMAVSGLASPMTGTSTLAKMAQMAKEGTKVGALAGATGEGAELLRGDVAGTAKDILTGGTTGAAVGAAIPAAIGAAKAIPSTAKAIAQKTPLVRDVLTGQRFAQETAEKLGKPQFIGKESQANLASKQAEETISELTDLKSKIGADIGKIEQLAADQGATVEVKAAIRNAKDKINEIETGGHPARTADKEAAIAQLDNIENRTFKTEGGEVRTQPVPAEAKMIREEVQEMAKDVKNTNSRLYGKLTALQKNLAKLTEGSISDIDDNLMSEYIDAKKQYAALSNVLKRAGTKSGQPTDLQKVPLQSTLYSGGDVKASNITEWLRNSGLEDQAKKFEDLYRKQTEYTALRKAGEKSTVSSTEGILKDIWLAMKRGASDIGSAYEIGKQKASQPIQNFIKNNGMSKAIKASSDEMNAVADRLTAANPKLSGYASTLKQLAGAPESRRAALLYGLYQQQAFREAIQEHAPEYFEDEEQTP